MRWYPIINRFHYNINDNRNSQSQVGFARIDTQLHYWLYLRLMSTKYNIYKGVFKYDILFWWLSNRYYIAVGSTNKIWPPRPLPCSRTRLSKNKGLWCLHPTTEIIGWNIKNEEYDYNIFCLTSYKIVSKLRITFMKLEY